MQLGLVVGTATSTVKHPSMQGRSCWSCSPIWPTAYAGRRSAIGVDAVGAGRGEMVMITSDGKYAREFLKADKTPVRWTVIGMKD